MGVFFILTISPFAGFELFDTRNTRGGDEVASYSRLTREAKLAILAIAGLVVLLKALETAESTIPNVRLIRQAIGVLSIPILVGAAFGLLLLPFYYLETKL